MPPARAAKTTSNLPYRTTCPRLPTSLYSAIPSPILPWAWRTRLPIRMLSVMWLSIYQRALCKRRALFELFPTKRFNSDRLFAPSLNFLCCLLEPLADLNFAFTPQYKYSSICGFVRLRITAESLHLQTIRIVGIDYIMWEVYQGETFRRARVDYISFKSGLGHIWQHSCVPYQDLQGRSKLWYLRVISHFKKSAYFQFILKL